MLYLMLLDFLLSFPGSIHFICSSFLGFLSYLNAIGTVLLTHYAIEYDSALGAEQFSGHNYRRCLDFILFACRFGENRRGLRRPVLKKSAVRALIRL